MAPQSKPIDSESPEEIRLQEQFVHQVDDHSLPAQEVLAGQQGASAPDATPSLFVP